MEFFTTAVNGLKIVVTAIGAGRKNNIQKTGILTGVAETEENQWAEKILQPHWIFTAG